MFSQVLLVSITEGPRSFVKVKLRRFNYRIKSFNILFFKTFLNEFDFLRSYVLVIRDTVSIVKGCL